jgi:UDP-glucose 6-dehydrogenase
MIIGIIGLGFVGSAMHNSFMQKDMNLVVYDKYKNGGIGSLDDVLKADILFLALPTLYDEETAQYNKSAIYETCALLSENNFQGTIVIKSTVEIGTHTFLESQYHLQFIHNPEFLTARVAYENFHNQTHVVLGSTESLKSENLDLVVSFYKTYYPTTKISLCSSKESEAMKLFCNTFYSIKIQAFTEFHEFCNILDISYNNVKDLMINNEWINPMHTIVPGNDGQISYGGLCFPKDTNALLQSMKLVDAPHEMLEACIKERNSMRDD